MATNSEKIQKQTIINDLRTLVSFPTVTIDPSEVSPSLEQLQPFSDTITYLKQRAREEGEKRGKPFVITEMESNGRPILIISTHATKTPNIAILTHIDTTELQTADQTTLKLVSDKAYGKGTYDMKYSAVASLNVLADLPTTDDISVSLMFTADEEKGARDGAQVLYQKGYRPDFLLVPDGSRTWTVTETSRALWHFRIEDILGKSGHASRPWESQNAVRRASDFDNQLSKKYPNPTEPSDAMTLSLADMGVPRKIDGRENDAPHNVVPGQAFLKYDARFGSQEEMDNFTQDLEKLVEEELPGAHIVTDEKDPYHTCDLTHPDAVLLMDIMEKHIGHTPEVIQAFGTTDAAFFPGVSSFIMLVEGDGAHTPNEWVSIKSITTFISILKDFIAKKSAMNRLRRTEPTK